MEKKELLKIAYAIATLQDFVSDDFDIEEIEEQLERKLSDEEVNQVILNYDGFGLDYLNDEIREEYFNS